MIDHVTLYIDDCTLFPCLISELKWKNLNFDPVYTQGEIICYKASYNNLQIRVFRDRITVKNSIHVFSKENNASDFTYDELHTSSNEIANFFNKRLHEIKVGSFEFGLNIRGQDCVNLWKNANAFKKKEISYMHSRSRNYGRKISLTEYCFKIYDKRLEQKLHYNYRIDDPITRFEIGYCKKRPVKFIQTLADLLDKKNLYKIFQKLKEALNAIEFFPGIEYLRTLPLKERELIYAIHNHKYWEIEGELRFEATKKRRTKFLREQKLLYPVDKIVAELDSKFEELIS